MIGDYSATTTDGSATEELPMLKDGTTDFDALFDQSVGRFYAQKELAELMKSEGK
ncbi:MAG: hypothetical protein SOW01_05150 [Mediterranea sp.]|nr:hypothetical protein [Mediterranea sp.]